MKKLFFFILLIISCSPLKEYKKTADKWQNEISKLEKLDESEACEFVTSITGDNSRELVSVGTEEGLFHVK